MDLKHFSHPHNLSFHQLPHGTEINCSGCKLPAMGNAYTCWPCRFFLHEQCFNAIRSIIHSSHPSHPLTLIPYPTYQSGSFICNSCSLAGTGFCYSCSNCDFDLHVHCASHIPGIAQKPYPNNQTPSFQTQYDSPPEILAHQSYPNSQHSNQPNGSVPNAPGLKQSVIDLLSAARVRLQDQSALNSSNGGYYFNSLHYPTTSTAEVRPKKEKPSKEDLSAARVRLSDQQILNYANGSDFYNSL